MQPCIPSALAFALLTLSAAAPLRAEPLPLTRDQVTALARDAYYYAFPLVLMDITMRQATNVPNATTLRMRAPVNQFAHFRAYPEANSRDIVRFNFDTLYSFAWLDLSKQPMVLTVPDSGGRYYLVPMLDMWTDVFAVPGSRTTGGQARNFLIVPPGWQGRVPKGLEVIQAPTPTVWVMGRTQTNGPADYANVHAVQDGYRLTPLRSWGKRYTPPASAPVDPSIDERTPPLTQVSALDGVTMLSRLAQLLKRNPPHPNDHPILMRLQALGITPGRDFDTARLDPATAQAINDGARAALADMKSSLARFGQMVNGWNLAAENVGTYGTSYKRRALVALAGLGANLPEDAIYPTAFVDSSGQPLHGANRYVLHFDKGALPPADAFWSITMYDKDGFQVPNPLNRFAIGDRDRLSANTDGSLDLYVQAESPGADKEANWLPAPKDAPFALTMRIYSPRPEAADGSWQPPAVRRQ
jgi:hypothetical protein